MLTPEQRAALHAAVDRAADQGHGTLVLAVSAEPQPQGDYMLHLERAGEDWPEHLVPHAGRLIRDDLAKWLFDGAGPPPAPPRKPMVQLFADAPPVD